MIKLQRSCLFSYDKNFDTLILAGKLVSQIIGVAPEFEKDIIRERIVAGLVNARAKASVWADLRSLALY